MRDIRSSITDLETQENKNLLFKKQTSDKLMRLGLTVTVLGILISIVLMILSRRALNQIARESFAQNSLLNSILGNLNQGLVILNSQGEVTFCNKTFEEILGFKITGLKIENINELLECVDPITRQPISKEQLPLARSLKGEVVSEMEYLIRVNRSQKEVIIRVSAQPILDSSNETVGAMALYLDVTKLKQQQEDLKRTREVAVDAAHMKSEFLIRMGHEIRTPMNGVIGLSNLLLNSKLNQEQESFVKNIQVSAHYLMNMIQSVLDQSLMEKKQLKLDSAPFKVAEMVQHIVTILEPSAQNRKVQLFLESDLDISLEVVSDSLRLQEVLIDLVEKAIFQTEKGFVTLKVQILEVFDGQARFYFEIKNSGSTGSLTLTPEAQLKDLLHQEIIRLLAAQVDSGFSEGFGAWYSVTLDLKLKKIEENKTTKKHIQFISDKPVLVAEDQTINQMVIKKYLERFGLNCHLVSDGKSAFIETTKNEYCLILMDCKMQPTDGYEATKLIRAEEKKSGKHLPIVALTADGTKEDRLRCEKVGMDDYLVKPIDLSQLENVLSKWIKPVFKEESLKKLDGYDMEGKPLIQVLAEDYFVSAPKLIGQIEKSIQDRDLKQLQYFSHTLKSASVTLGLIEISAYCEKLEQVQTLNASSLSVLNQIKESYKNTEPILKKRISNESSRSQQS